MRNHVLIFSAMILVTTTVSARAQSLTSPESLLPNAQNPVPAPSPFNRNYLVLHDSRNQVPSIDFVAARLRLEKQKQVLMARSTSICYTVRTYNFPTDGSADMTKSTSSTTCEVPKEASLKRSTVQIPR